MDKEDEDNDEFNLDLSHSSSTLQDVEAGGAELAGEEESSEKFRFPDFKGKNVNKQLIDLIERLKKLKQAQAGSRGFRIPEYPTRGYKNVGKSNSAHILDEEADVEDNDDGTSEDAFDTNSAYDADATEVEGRGLGEKKPQEKLVRHKPWLKKRGNEMSKGGRIPIKFDGRKLIDSDVDDYLVDEDVEKLAAIAAEGETPVLSKREKLLYCACCATTKQPSCCGKCFKKID